MKPYITVLTLGVDDLERSLAFYRVLGFETEGILGQEFEDGAVVFFELQNNTKLALFPRRSLAKDAGIAQTPASPTEFSIGPNVPSEAEVGEIMAQAEKAGATIIKKAQKTFWSGYAGYFQDPDGHLWEVAYNPAWEDAETS